MHTPDHEILTQFKDNPEQGFSTLVATYNKKLYFYIRRYTLCHEDTDDVLQNTFLKIWQQLHKFKGESSLYTWLYRIATNETLQFIRKRNKEISRLQIKGEEIEALLRSDSHFNGDDIQVALYKAIDTLPKQQKLIFTLRYFEELPHQDIADILKLSVGSVKASYHIAVQKIEKILQPQE